MLLTASHTRSLLRLMSTATGSTTIKLMLCARAKFTTRRKAMPPAMGRRAAESSRKKGQQPDREGGRREKEKRRLNVRPPLLLLSNNVELLTPSLTVGLLPRSFSSSTHPFQ